MRFFSQDPGVNDTAVSQTAHVSTASSSTVDVTVQTSVGHLCDIVCL